MFRGDISNHSAPVIALDLDSLLYTEDDDSGEKKGIIQRILNLTRRNKKIFDLKTLEILNYIWAKHDASLYLVTFNINKEETLNDIYEHLSNMGIAITDIVYHPEWEDVLYRLGNGTYAYFFSADSSLLSYLGKNAFHIEDFREVL